MRPMPTRLVTAAELPHLPAEYRNELVRGVVRPMTPPGFRHADVAQRLAEIIGPYVRARGLGIYIGSEAGFWIERDPDTVRGPDGSFLTSARLRAIGSPVGYVDGPPDLAVEIVSPNDRASDVRDKARMWVACGAQSCLVLDPATRTTTVHTAAGERVLPADATLEFGDLIPGLAIALARVFP